MASKFSKGKKQEIDYSAPSGRLPQYWSFTRLTAFEKCPFLYSCQFIFKLEQPPSDALERGSKIHKDAEDYVNRKRKGLTRELSQFREEFAAVRKLDAVAEESYTVTKTWQPTHATDWDHAWLRAKVDIEILQEEVLTVVDIKTGRRYPEHADQAGIYGTLGFIIHPDVEQVDFEYWYVDSGEVETFEFDLGGQRTRKREWQQRANKMIRTKLFEPNPTEKNCRYCAYRSDRQLANGKDGPCHAWKEA